MVEIASGSPDAGSHRKKKVAHAWNKMTKGFWGPAGDVVADNPQQQEVSNTYVQPLTSVLPLS